MQSVRQHVTHFFVGVHTMAGLVNNGIHESVDSPGIDRDFRHCEPHQYRPLLHSLEFNSYCSPPPVFRMLVLGKVHFSSAACRRSSKVKLASKARKTKIKIFNFPINWARITCNNGRFPANREMAGRRAASVSSRSLWCRRGRCRRCNGRREALLRRRSARRPAKSPVHHERPRNDAALARQCVCRLHRSISVPI